MYSAIGMMSGTSMDGIDVAVLRSDGEARLERGPSAFFPYEDAFRRRIEAGLRAASTLTDRHARPGELAGLEQELTRRHATAARKFIESLPSAFAGVDLIGFHGQTVLHRPERGLTVQLGDGEWLARELGIDVVHDMRASDMAHGGQGAPLVPAYHAALASMLALPLPAIFVNIGGISNITFLGHSGDPLAFDTGPGNMLVDRFVQSRTGLAFDEDGRIGAGGHVAENVVREVLAASYFDLPPPKSLDRGDFGIEVAEGLPLADGARTLAVIAARAIWRGLEHLPARPGLWVICGGGRRNPLILDELARLADADGAALRTSEALGLDGDAIEAEAWAYLAIRSCKGLPLTFPGTTGCARPVSGGILARGRPLPSA